MTGGGQYDLIKKRNYSKMHNCTAATQGHTFCSIIQIDADIINIENRYSYDIFINIFSIFVVIHYDYEQIQILNSCKLVLLLFSF